jgi:two-component system, NarL family, response regulator LiaR
VKRIRVLVVDDHNMVREGLVAILGFQSDIDVVGQAEEGAEAELVARQTKPDVILLDLLMPNGQGGVETIPKIQQILPDTKILALSAHADTELIFSAIQAGAQGYMLKDATREQLYQGIRDVSQGQAFLHPAIAMQVIRKMKTPPAAPSVDPDTVLTSRELETLRYIGRGFNNKDIAEKLVLNERTVAKYVSVILNKLHLANRTQAALYAVNSNLVQPDGAPGQDSNTPPSGDSQTPPKPPVTQP